MSFWDIRSEGLAEIPVGVVEETLDFRVISGAIRADGTDHLAPAGEHVAGFLDGQARRHGATSDVTPDEETRGRRNT